VAGVSETADLFSWPPPPSYPDVPGAYPVDTAIEAAEHIEGRAHTLRGLCLDVLRRHPEGLTADEVAHEMGESVLSIRPRLSELKLTGKIADSGTRRLNRSGRRAAVMILSERN
jgi:hypothetical protein